MSQDQGASARADRATRASPEPASGLGQKASVPCAFTPGPWAPMTDGPAERDPWEPWAAHLEAAPGLTIGSIHNTEPVVRVSGYCQPCEANARLIAAAPDLYSELEHAQGLLLCSGIIVDAIDAALAKARGEQVPA